MTNLAFVFPGQGSQSIGMLSELATQYPQVKEVFQQISDEVSYDVWQLIQQGPVEKLNQTEYTQVAMLGADVAVFRTLQSISPIKAKFMAGHSLGEYAALVCADALTLPDAARLVAARGRIMQETMPLGLGTMAAIVGLSDEQVVDICTQASDSNYQVSPANFNAIGQVVVAGHTQAVEKAIALAESQEARLAKIIPVSVPCHCGLLKETAEKFEAYLTATAFQKPDTAVVSNVDLSIYETADHIRSLLKAQLHKPVRWVETIQKIQANEVELIIECGPGKVLSGLIKRINRQLSATCIYDLASLESGLSLLKTDSLLV